MLTCSNLKWKKSEVSSHIFECKEYEKSFNQRFFVPGRKERKEFLFSHFDILSKNLNGYRDRTIMEALFIRMYSPKLNIQNDHRNTVIIWRSLDHFWFFYWIWACNFSSPGPNFNKIFKISCLKTSVCVPEVLITSKNVSPASKMYFLYYFTYF